METISNFGILLLVLGGIFFILGLVSIFVGRKWNIPVSIPGDGFRPAIPPDGMPMPNFMPPTERKAGTNSFERLGADGNWHPVSDVREGFYGNGSALVTNERGNPQRVSRRCLSLRCS